MENNNRSINQQLDRNPMPNIELFPRFTRIATAVGRFLAPQKLDLSTSTHIREHGAEAMLDAALDERYEQGQLDFEHQVGHDTFCGDITAQEAYDMLASDKLAEKFNQSSRA